MHGSQKIQEIEWRIIKIAGMPGANGTGVPSDLVTQSFYADAISADETKPL